jgi:hypothetical protein
MRGPTALDRLLAGASGFHGSAIFHMSPAPFTPALPEQGQVLPSVTFRQKTLVRLFGLRPRREIDSYPAINKERWEVLC